MIFLDVGANVGQTLEEVVDPRYAFERIHAFEPEEVAFRVMESRYRDHPRVEFHPFGLSDRTGYAPLYGTNDKMEASAFPSKRDVDETVSVTARYVAASEFFRDRIPAGGVVMKLNCEGSEVPILDDLLDSGEIWKVAHMVVCFDIRTVEGAEAEEDRVVGRLADAGFDRYDIAEDVMVGETHQDRIRAWLEGSGLT